MKRSTIFSIAILALFACAMVFDAAAASSLAHLSTLDVFGGFAGASAVAALPEAIKAELDRINNEVKEAGTKALKEVERIGTMSTETKNVVDGLLAKQGETQTALQSLQQLVAKLENGDGDGAKAQKSIGEVVAAAESIKNFNTSMQGAAVVKLGSLIRNVITSLPTSAGELVVPQRLAGIIAPPNQRLFLRDLLPVGRTQTSSIEYVREEGFTNNAAPVSENPTGIKPESNITFELDQAPVVTIAHWIRASKQILADAAMLTDYINARLIYGLKIKEELQLLMGTGVGLNINGLYTQASNYVNPGVTVQAETAVDRIRIAMLQATLAEYDADGIVLNPIDWTQIELTKTSDNAYLFAQPQGVVGPRLWGRPVVATQAMSDNQFLVGAFQLGAQIWDREDASITVSNSDRDNFVKNLVTILAEERLALTVYRPEAFVKGNFSGLPVT